MLQLSSSGAFSVAQLELDMSEPYLLSDICLNG